MTISVRIAPSPTGLLHIGNIRAALFNYLFARKTGGKFMLRLDDTDSVRSTQEFAEAIARDLKWLGFTWDSFVRQSDRLARYDASLEELKKTGRVYRCYETQEELALKRRTQLGRGLPPVYDRAALNLTEAECAQLEAQGKKPHWRFKLNHTDVIWDDVVQGHKSFPAASLSDPVLMREDGVPLYTFCSVIDDVDYAITHIVRGEDHVTNTAVQIQIWQAITQKPVPVFAHFPLIVSATGEEMSKRLGTLSVRSMRDEMEMEPMAICSLLGSLGTSEPIAPHQSLVELESTFGLEKISRATPKFDLEEMRSLNAKILHMTPFNKVQDRLKAQGLKAVNENFWNMARANIRKLSDVGFWWTVAHGPVTPQIFDVSFLDQALAALPTEPWNDETWGLWTSTLKQKTGRKGKELFMPLRLALTGVEHGPEMKTLLPMIGRARASALLSGKVA